MINSAGTVLVPMEEKADAEGRAAGATEGLTNLDARGKIVEFLWYLKKEGYSEDTIKTYVKIIERLINLGANIFDPENVKAILAEIRCE